MADVFAVGVVKTANVAWADAAGNVARIDESDQALVWESSNAAVMTVVANAAPATGATCTMIAPGTAQVIVRADADLDTGEVRELVVVGDVEVVAGEAVAGTISFA